MGLSQGTRIDSCEILELLGSGGMGEVYRARDTKLGRDVAIKVLPEAFAHDEQRMGRFEREAQVLAALNHPNIAAIHELKEAGGAKYLVLELVEGETLAERISRGPIPIDEILPVAKQIAEALEAAHDKGIVHRDLKPANIKITPEGRAKVLDFGLAKIHEPSDSSQSFSRSPTLSGLNTAGGIILGTAAYMSPEQARGKRVDRRADVWSFGCVLYEMIVGRKAFAQGETVSDTLAGILAREPDWQALPPDLPSKIRSLLERCLKKDPTRRLQDMGNARIELEEARSESEVSAVMAAAAPELESRRREKIAAVAAAVSFVIAAVLATAFLFAPAPDIQTRRFEASIPSGMVPDSGFNLSPDGLKIAFVTNQPAQIWVRSLDSATAESIPSTEGITGANIFWSSDSQDIGFLAEGKLKRVPASGGPAQVLATLPAGGNYFGTWSPEGVILLGSDGTPGGPLLRVPASGGQPEPATELDKSRKETAHGYPHFLPDGRRYLYLAVGGDARDRIAYVGDLNSTERIALPGIAAEVKYSSDHLVFIRDGALMAQPFDADDLELSGRAFPVADPFAPPSALTYPFSVSLTGALTHRTNPATGGGATGGGNTLLVWYDQRGTRLPDVAGAEGEFRGPELSPDGKYVAFARGAPADIWILDIANARTDRLTSHESDDLNPRWSPDGKTIAFDSVREGAANLYQRAVGVVSEDKLVLKTESAKTMSDWSRDGKYLVYTADNDIWAIPLSNNTKAADSKSAEPKPIQITKTSFIEMTPRISPDGRWVAYASNEPGEYRIYIQSFPEPGIKQPVSTRGGIEPRWSTDGKELFYYTGAGFPYTGNAGALWAASIQSMGSSLTVGAPAQRAPRGVNGTTAYSVAADRRFLLQTTLQGAGRGMAGRPIGTNRENSVITFILNWTANRGQ